MDNSSFTFVNVTDFTPNLGQWTTLGSWTNFTQSGTAAERTIDLPGHADLVHHRLCEVFGDRPAAILRLEVAHGSRSPEDNQRIGKRNDHEG